MHTIFGIRGIKHEVDRFINELATRYVAMNIYNFETKKLERKMVQLRLSPMQFYDLSFPKEHYDAVMNTIYGTGKGKGIDGRLDWIVKLIRKVIGLKPMPEWKKDYRLAMEDPQHTEIIGLGVREDYWITEEGKHVNEKDKTPLSYEGI